MKIDGVNVNNISKQYLDKNIEANKEINKDAKKYDIVNVEISDTAKALVDRIKESKDTSMSARVEEIRKSIISENYKVSTDQIADKIMKELDLQISRDIR